MCVYKKDTIDSEGNALWILSTHIDEMQENLETWERGIHPRDLEEVSRTFQEAFQDKTNEKKYDVEYRMRLADGSYQWFRDKG